MMDGGSGREEQGAKGSSKMGGKERRKVESLGWLTESSVMPKKQRAIAGVGASSIVELRAELYKTQEDVKKAKEGDVEVVRSRKKIGVPEKKNAGVDERAAKDALHLKAVEDGKDVYAALEKKAELYEKLSRGELNEEEAEMYNVDFFRKGLLEDERLEMEEEDGSRDLHGKINDSSDLGSVHTRSQGGWIRDGASGLTQEHKQIIREVNEETKDAREKTSTLKQQRLLQSQKKREALRQAYLKRQVEKLKSQKQQSASSADD
ncbi:hypothetical protein AXG93_3233s1080 [Marchantia polymorpha subsp. ruderalis]|uniref:Uncharacterized protein n=1 Tax=Marchantia polymorpha subsp. ruderalis TaxID=1480154 RepID=A0A176WBB1_MARPO|nr:hypothetical protein AXG93_3233s1080 [Marchantia polymorpha subsp. ruderalis]